MKGVVGMQETASTHDSCILLALQRMMPFVKA